MADPIDIPIVVKTENDFSDNDNNVEDNHNLLDNDRLGATETMLLTNVPQPEDITIAPGEGTQPMSILMDKKM